MFGARAEKKGAINTLQNAVFQSHSYRAQEIGGETIIIPPPISTPTPVLRQNLARMNLHFYLYFSHTS